jgi:hypothetical protein
MTESDRRACLCESGGGLLCRIHCVRRSKGRWAGGGKRLLVACLLCRRPPVAWALLRRVRRSLVLGDGSLHIRFGCGLPPVELALPLLFVLAFLLELAPALLEIVVVLSQNGLLVRMFPTHKRNKRGLRRSMRPAANALVTQSARQVTLFPIFIRRVGPANAAKAAAPHRCTRPQITPEALRPPPSPPRELWQKVSLTLALSASLRETNSLLTANHTNHAKKDVSPQRTRRARRRMGRVGSQPTRKRSADYADLHRLRPSPRRTRRATKNDVTAEDAEVRRGRRVGWVLNPRGNLLFHRKSASRNHVIPDSDPGPQSAIEGRLRPKACLATADHVIASEARQERG